MCSEQEKSYLLKAYNHYFIEQADESDVVESFAGVRPLIKSSDTGDASRLTRDYAMERQGNLLSVYGGKWTTARALANKVVEEII